MNSTQIQDSINSGIYAKNISFPTPFSKGAYLAFVDQWKTTYARLSLAIRANKELERDFHRPISKLTAEREATLKQQAKFEFPTTIGFVQVKDIATPGWMLMSLRLKATARLLLVLRKQMKIEAGKLAALHLSANEQP